MTNSKPYFLEKLDARIPEWNLSTLINRNCPFCDTVNESLLVRPDRLPLAFCPSCGCWYVSKMPSDSEITKLYDGYYHIHRPADLSEKKVSQIVENARRESKNDWQLQTLSQVLGGLSGKRIMDVGCGWGHFLLKAKFAGADVIGCDLSPEACEFVENRLGITAYQSELQLLSSSINKVDAIVMNDLIEHPVNPLIVVHAAYDILKPGGLILLHTPNGGGAGINLETAKNWVGFRVDLEHLQYISPCTINWLSQRLNMNIERLTVFGFPNLKGLGKLPNRTSTIKENLKNAIKQIPFVSKAFQIMQLIKTSSRLGSYHLFTILRKV